MHLAGTVEDSDRARGRPSHVFAKYSPGGKFHIFSDVSLASGWEPVSLRLLPTPAMWLPCGSLELCQDDSAGPLEEKGMPVTGAGVGGKSREQCLNEVLDQVRWPMHPLRFS